jgi:hypothetical protein
VSFEVNTLANTIGIDERRLLNIIHLAVGVHSLKRSFEAANSARLHPHYPHDNEIVSLHKKLVKFFALSAVVKCILNPDPSTLPLSALFHEGLVLWEVIPFAPVAVDTVHRLGCGCISRAFGGRRCGGGGGYGSRWGADVRVNSFDGPALSDGVNSISTRILHGIGTRSCKYVRLRNGSRIWARAHAFVISTAHVFTGTVAMVEGGRMLGNGALTSVCASKATSSHLLESKGIRRGTAALCLKDVITLYHKARGGVVFNSDSTCDRHCGITVRISTAVCDLLNSSSSLSYCT